MAVKFTKPEINVREKLAELDKPSGIAGEAMLRAETPQEQFNLIGAGRRNIIINGDMRVAQRGTSTSNVTTNGYFTVDRWAVEGGGQVAFDTSQVTSDNPGGFPCSIKVSRNSTGGTLVATHGQILAQKIEASTLTGLGYGTPNAKSMTLSFYVKASMVGKYALNLYADDSGAARIYTHTYTVDAVGEWKKIEITVPPDSAGNFNNDNGIGMYMQWFFRAGSNYTSGTDTDKWLPWVSANYGNYAAGQVDIFSQANGYFQITGVQLEFGKVATPFEHRSYGEELALCQRYCQTYTGTDQEWIYIESAQASHKWWQINLETHMRADPSVTYPSVSASIAGSAGTITSQATISTSPNRISVRCTCNAVGGNAYEMRHTDGLDGLTYIMSAEL
jgi:hypothetical protein